MQRQIAVGDDRTEWRHTVPEMTLSQVDSGGFFEVKPDGRITVQLPETPSTGYVWAVDKLDGQVLSLEDSSFLPVNDSSVGSGAPVC